ncbi:MAG: Re/Si-specific NAD(P)(+) transhydrogenase subunit alpha [Alphaproteobacteria bacterium]|jgi:NAD(P) transhydrogenase subunit alpha|nr:Re/Si-specific NAD(P)(+) transhydrogenase subunit alpha [Alphaproteobacteria bacterium]
MKIAIVKETEDLEKRVAGTPETVKKLISLGFSVDVEEDAGINSFFSNALYKTAGANIVSDTNTIVSSADIVLKVNNVHKDGKGADNIKYYKNKTKIIGSLKPLQNKEKIKDLANNNIDAFSVELIPRISRAQSMDALSSQSNLAGYKAVIDSVSEFSKAIPMMMTAAGTIAPAKILILGAGVAGLQAIATARRLGAIVSAFDVRAAAKEQVESLGAKFIEVVLDNTEVSNNETDTGYAKEMSEEYKKQQKDLLHQTIKTQDIVITTALIPGKEAPELITTDMVKDMKPGSIIVDLAAEAGGNCKLTKLNETIIAHNVKIMGYANFPSKLSQDASSLYSKNLFNFVQLMVKDKKIEIDWEDEILQKSCVSYDGKVLNI